MPRRARLVLPGVAHHVTQRGNNRQKVFFSDEDRAVYLDRLFAYTDQYKVRVLAYCLMPNHVHVVVVPPKSESLAKAFGCLHSAYARYLNVKRGAVGHAWQSRFYSHPMDEWHTICAIAYIERNPLRARIVKHPQDFRWSSVTAHLRGFDERGQIEFDPWRRWYSPERWEEVLALGLHEEACRDRFRAAMRCGLPLGDPDWILRLQMQLGRDLSIRPPGRPASGHSRARAATVTA